MDDLVTKLRAIKADKDTNLLPENIVAGVTVLGVTGTHVDEDLSSVITAQEETIAELQEAVKNKTGGPATKYTGIHVDFENGTITRLGETNVNNLKCYSDRKRCNVQDDGTVTAYYSEQGYDDVGNENLQVMVEQPIVYYSIQNVVLENDDKSIKSCDYLVADEQMLGFELHPAFTDDTNVFDKIYIGAFEATGINNKLSSVGGGTSTPLTNKTRAQFRTMAQSRGTGWQLITKQIQDLESLLMAIEYRSFDFQTNFSYGVANSADYQNVGQAYTLNANGTGLKGADKTVSDCFTWRWRENPYGNVWKFLDGINIYGSNYYISNYIFQDATGTNFDIYKIPVFTSDGWITRFEYNGSFKWLFMNGTIGSSDTGIIKDKTYLNSANSWSVPDVSGNRDYGDGVGMFTNGYEQTSYKAATVGCVLCARFVEGGTVNE